VSKIQQQTSATKQTHNGIDFDTILSQPAYVTNLNDFLQEENDAKALRYAAETFIAKGKPDININNQKYNAWGHCRYR